MIYSRELEKNYYKCHFHCLLTIKIIDGMFDNYLSNSPTNILTDKKITDGMKYNFFYRWDVIFSDGNIDEMKWVKFFFGTLCPLVNPYVQLLSTDSLIDHKSPMRVFLIDYFCAYGL
jgi:hypothetical protein